MVIISAARRRMRTADEPIPEKGDLVLSTGEFLLTDTGVTARLKPPLDRFSGHYSWSMLPRGLATLVSNDGAGDGLDSLVTLLRIPEATLDMLEQSIGKLKWFIGEGEQDVCEYETDLVDDVVRLCEWGARIATRCPNQIVAQDLSRIPTLPAPELVRVAMG